MTNVWSKLTGYFLNKPHTKKWEKNTTFEIPGGERVTNNLGKNKAPLEYLRPPCPGK